MNSFLKDTRRIVLFVSILQIVFAVSPPKIRPFQFTNGLKEGQREQIICAVLEGDSPFIFTWMKDQMEIEGHSDIKTEKNEFYSVLIFPSVHAQNIGNYSCIIENSFGSDRFTAALVIKGTMFSTAAFHDDRDLIVSYFTWYLLSKQRLVFLFIY
ncbi:Down syndrome cell adhesion molecule-like protein Dscam2 [Centruroides sculpturatus]|uniref:Down syndrome cell adhesion molecule-like protein Dscam2 n=1 Tax=Centruroides sculpturatus TaxID=218467 RepID=UPI000C6EF14F|nr:Down syndrome cell adhesion molecule-like protein Dscam2 [Centruroides sculpturatus]